MRISYMYYLLKSSLEDLERVKDEQIKLHSFDCLSFSDFSSLKRGINKLSSMDMFKKRTKEISKFFPHSNSEEEDNTLKINIANGVHIRKTLNDIKTSVSEIITFLEQAGFDKNQSGFDIKMPPTDDFNEFAKNISMLQKVLQLCPYLNIDGETIKIDSVDIGSVWLKFAVIATSTSIILGNLATLTDKCVKIRSHNITCKQQEEQYRAMGLKNEALQNLIDVNKQASDVLFNNTIKELELELEDKENPLSEEDRKRVELSVKQLCELMDKGLEIYASIDAPREIKDAFPTSDEMKLLSSSKDLLTDGVQSNDEE